MDSRFEEKCGGENKGGLRWKKKKRNFVYVLGNVVITLLCLGARGTCIMTRANERGWRVLNYLLATGRT
jgi:hypothetical protein